jgi:hypothetical protein
VFNRRLPETTARDILLVVPIGDSWSGQRADKAGTRRNVRGSRLFNEVWGHARAQTKGYGFFRVPSKAAPLQACDRYTKESALKSLPRIFEAGAFIQRFKTVV